MEKYEVLERGALGKPAMSNPKQLDFTNSFFNELKTFNVEEQVEILNSLYRKLENVYQDEIDVNLKKAEDYKNRLSILKKIEPKN